MTLQLARIQTETNTERGLQQFIDNAFKAKMPSLIPLVYANESVLKFARQLKRSNCSPKTLYQYVFGIHRFCDWAQKKPDQIIDECFGPDGEQQHKTLTLHTAILSDFVDNLQDEGLAPGTICNHFKGCKQLYRANGIHIELPFRLSKKVKFRDRSPTAEEMERLLDIADLRGKVIICLLALGGFRVGTLAKLCYGHLEDLERGVTPLLVRVPDTIVKGGYCSYWTFLSEEAVQFLKRYIENRRKGIPIRGGTNRLPPETITDSSPIIRDEHTTKIRPISPARLHDIVHELYLKAGLLRKGSETRYELRAHSIRKYFKTELLSLKVQPDYVDFMMGHVVDTYHDIEMKGVEFLRGIYSASGLSIRPKTQLSKIEMAKQVLAAVAGVRPEEISIREAQAHPHRSYASPEAQLEVVMSAIREAVRKDIVRSV